MEEMNTNQFPVSYYPDNGEPKIESLLDILLRTWNHIFLENFGIYL